MLLGAALFLWGRRTEHELCLCTRCGTRIVVRRTFFNFGLECFGAPKDTSIAADGITTRPSILTELFPSVESCDHGFSATARAGNAPVQEGKRSLIFLDSYVDSPLGRYGYYAHTTWIDRKCSCFFAPNDPVPAWNGLDRAKFRKFLLDKKSQDPGFAKRLRNDLQTRIKSPWDCVKALLDEFARQNNAQETKITTNN